MLVPAYYKCHLLSQDVPYIYALCTLGSRLIYRWMYLDWDREEDLVYKDILICERDLVKRGKKELQDIKKNLKTRSNEETKTKISNLGVEIKAKETELFTWVRKNENHKVQFDDDESLHTFFSQMDDLMSCSELSTKTNLRKNIEAKIDNLIDSCEDVVIDKVGDLWGIFDELPKDHDKWKIDSIEENDYDLDYEKDITEYGVDLNIE